jgi:hypothetical protein
VRTPLLLLTLIVGPAQGVPGGWTPLGQVHLDKSGCTDCPGTFATPIRQRSFGLATDSPYAISLAGQVEVVCADGTTYLTLVRSATRGGLFQTIGNACANLDSKELRLTLTTVSLSPPDADRTVALTAYGRLR